MQESSREADPTARTYVYTCLCTQANRLKYVRTFLIGYRSGDTPDILRNLRARDGIAGRRRGSSACQRSGDLPALRVACRCSPVGFDRQHTRTRGHKLRPVSVPAGFDIRRYKLRPVSVPAGFGIRGYAGVSYPLPSLSETLKF